MIRATTPKHIFAFENDPSEFSRILVTYSQNGQIVLEKTQDDMTFGVETDEKTGDEIYVAWYRLSQEETLRFKSEQPTCGVHGKKQTKVSVQVRVLTAGGEALASQPFEVSVEDVQNDEVLT